MSYAAHWELLVDRAVHKQLHSFPKKDAERILEAIAEMAVNPYSGDIRKMRGEEDVWRRRIGAYRVFYEVLSDERIVSVCHV